MTREDNDSKVSDMTAVVTRSRSPISVQGWDELRIPDSYRAEIVDDELVVMPKVAGTVPPITVDEWEAVEVPEGYRAEIVQGVLVVSPAPSFDHNRVASNLFGLFAADTSRLVMFTTEWRLGEGGLVAGAPQPDLIVIPRAASGVDAPPILGVEVLSPTDRSRLRTGQRLTRIEGKRIDYAVHGLADYIEVDWVDGRPVVIRYENRDGIMVEVDRAEGDKALVSDRPFPYEIVPARLLD